RRDGAVEADVAHVAVRGGVPVGEDVTELVHGDVTVARGRRGERDDEAVRLVRGLTVVGHPKPDDAAVLGDLPVAAPLGVGGDRGEGATVRDVVRVRGEAVVEGLDGAVAAHRPVAVDARQVGDANRGGGEGNVVVAHCAVIREAVEGIGRDAAGLGLAARRRGPRGGGASRRLALVEVVARLRVAGRRSRGGRRRVDRGAVAYPHGGGVRRAHRGRPGWAGEGGGEGARRGEQCCGAPVPRTAE